MNYDFDKIIDRHNTHALKTDALKPRYGRPDLIPLWVADMDFATPKFIIDAFKKRLEHPILGYTVTSNAYFESIINWQKRLHDFDVKREWLSFIPGVVRGIGMVINACLKSDEKVIIQPPVYHPFRLTPLANNREVVFNPLIKNADGSFSMDFENLEKVADDKCKLLILSNPHNPAGISWDKDSLKTLAAFCSKHKILVISDEIHGDMVLRGEKHYPFASVSNEAAQCSITFAAPSKTFNIPGVISSYAIVINPEIRKKFYGWVTANELNEPHIFAEIGTIAAFSDEGFEWRNQMLRYIEGNIDFLAAWMDKNIPEIKVIKPQASFLVWLDCRDLGLDHAKLNDFFINKAKLALNDGEMFGPGGEGCMRLNVGTPRGNLEKALSQLKNAVLELKTHRP